MNKKKAMINILTSTVLHVVLLIISLLLRRYLLRYIGNEAVGLFSLYTSILGFLSIANLGIGTAITFSMYKPLVEDDHDTISGLYYLYRKVYLIIFGIILVVGLALTPLIPIFAKDNTGTFNIPLTYILFLLATLTTYLFAPKTSFINANLDVYVTTLIRSIGLILEAIGQILVLIFIAKNNIVLGFNLFMVVMLSSKFLQWVATNIIFKLKYSNKVNGNKELSKEVTGDVVQKTKAMFFHKIGGLLVNTTDSLIISAFISVTVLGIYTNYVTLAAGLASLLALVFSSLTTIIGQSYAKNGKEVFYRQFNFIYLINFILGLIFFLGFYAVINSSINLLFLNDATLLLSKQVVIIITMNYFVQFMRQSVLSFRDASGAFYHDRYKPLFEGVVNLVLSLALVNLFGISGVLIATIFTNLTITHTVEPHVLYKYSFEKDPKKYYLYNYIGILIFAGSIALFELLPIKGSNRLIIDILIKGSMSLVISFGVLTIIYLVNKTFRQTFNDLFKRVISFVKKPKNNK